MIEISNTKVFGYEAAIRGMRNPMNSWDKSDSGCRCSHEYDIYGNCDLCSHYIGENDYELMLKLCKAGTDHRKFMRMINVTCDIVAPLYWWKEFETYRVGVAPNPMDIEINSCSTMHKIADKEFTIEDFSCEHLSHTSLEACIGSSHGLLKHTIYMLNKLRNLYLETKDKKYWWQMIQLLPSSYNQKRTMMMNYEVLANIYKSRKNHKLDEWREFCKWIESLPYSELIVVGE